ncbi:hypothetical protein [Campylobacter majalis]|uniref:hypothetical protein n=1 Tax=Campylobacter majalis TaxID=2790656 RepID=UPI003D68C957
MFGKIDLIIKYANIIDPSALSEIIRFAKNLYNTLKQQYLTNDEDLREFCHEQLNIIAHATDQPACRDFLSLIRIPKSNYYKDFLRRGENGGLVLNYDTKAGDVMLSKAMQFGDLLHKKYKTDHPRLNSMAVQILILANCIIDLEKNSYDKKSDLSYFKF